jgi:hypothetical protein
MSMEVPILQFIPPGSQLLIRAPQGASAGVRSELMLLCCCRDAIQLDRS